jgi:hypothetical protein
VNLVVGISVTYASDTRQISRDPQSASQGCKGSRGSALAEGAQRGLERAGY